MKIYSGGPLQVPEVSLAGAMFEVAKNHPQRVGFRIKENGKFVSYTWAQVAERVRTLGNGLLSLGIEKNDKVAILADTRGEWALADFGVLAIGGVTVTVYPTLADEQIAYLLNDSGSKVVIVENEKQLQKLQRVASKMKTVQRLVTIDDVANQGELAKMTMPWRDLEAAGKAFAAKHPQMLDQRLAQTKPDDVATLVYTSGTTGTPKGAVLTHRNFVAAYKSANKLLEIADGASTVVFLPLAHCYGRITVFFVMDSNGDIAFGSPATLGDDLRAIKPNVVSSVPRLYERMFDQIQHGVSQTSPGKQKIFHRAQETAKEMGRAKANGQKPGLMLRLKWSLYDRLVYKNLREKLGFTNLHCGVTGSAAIRPELLYFFQGIGANVLEGYGLTETSAPSNVNPPRKFKPGTVGPPFPGMDMRLDDDGEVLMKGPNVFKGYYNLPKETAESFTADGWFRTGDIGKFDADGYLSIVDRKKELEVLDTGKKIAPVAVEEMLKTVSPLVGDACLIGTGRKFAGILIQPNLDSLVAWAKTNNVSFDASKIVVKPDPTGTPTTYSVGDDLVKDAAVLKLYAGEIAKCNERVAEYERVKVFRIVPNMFSIDRDELTPSLKKKRRVITKNYAHLIDEMFSEKPPAKAR